VRGRVDYLRVIYLKSKASVFSFSKEGLREKKRKGKEKAGKED